MKTLETVRTRYNEIKRQWDAAIEANDGNKLEALEDALMDAEDALRDAFMTKMKVEATPAEFAAISSIAYTEQFIERIAAP